MLYTYVDSHVEYKWWSFWEVIIQNRRCQNQENGVKLGVRNLIHVDERQWCWINTGYTEHWSTWRSHWVHRSSGNWQADSRNGWLSQNIIFIYHLEVCPGWEQVCWSVSSEWLINLCLKLNRTHFSVMFSFVFWVFFYCDKSFLWLHLDCFLILSF